MYICANSLMKVSLEMQAFSFWLPCFPLVASLLSCQIHSLIHQAHVLVIQPPVDLSASLINLFRFYISLITSSIFLVNTAYCISQVGILLLPVSPAVQGWTRTEVYSLYLWMINLLLPLALASEFARVCDFWIRYLLRLS